MRKYIESNIIHETKNMTQKQWLEARRTGIGGSDASSVLRLNPYKSVVTVYMDKVLPKDKIDFEINNKNNYKMELGSKLEDFVANEFSRKTGKKVRNINGILQNEKYPFAIANIDRAVIGEKAFLECKVTNSFAKKEWSKDVPIQYQIQCYHYMAVSGATHCYVAALIGNEELIIHRLERDEELIEEIMKLEENFWNRYIKGQEIPMPDGTDDYSKFLKEKYKISKDETMLLFIEDEKLNRYDEINRLIKELDYEKKSIEQYVQSEMKEYEVAYIGDRKITWKNQERKSIDTKKIKEEMPEIAEKYMKTTISRVFKI